MEEIEQIALKTYELNMQYLQENHPTLHKDLLNFDKAMQSNHHVQRYDLEYVEGNFDIKDLSTGKYLYNKESNKVSAAYAQQTTLDKNISVIEIFGLFDLDQDGTIFNKHAFHAREYIFPFMKYSLEHSQKNAKMKEIVKFIFSGVGLGLHIEAIHQKIHASRYLIIEDNIEFFKLSLFTTPYYEVAKTATIYFSVLEDVHTFTNTYNKFIDDAYIYNNILKYTHIRSHALTKLKHLISLTAVLPFVVFPYQLQLDRSISALKYIKKSYPFLNIYKDIDKSVLSDKPILVLASGPSLGKNMKWLQENHKKFLLVAVSSSLKYLYKNKIVPDIVVSVDQQEIVKDFFSDFKDNDYLSNTILIFSSVTHENVIKSIDKNKLYITDSSHQFKSENLTFSYSCVGSFAYLYSLNLKAANTYVLGLDLAVDQETGDDHISEHIATTKIDMQDKASLPTSMSITKTLIPIEGNFHETVYTTPSFHSSIYSISQFATRLKTKDQNVYNLNHGARINAADPMEISDIDVESMPKLDKTGLHSSLQTALNKNSSTQLTDAEVELILKNKNSVKKIKNIILKYSKKRPSSDDKIYLDRVIKLADAIYSSDIDKRMKIAPVYKAYLEYALNIIYNFLNTQNIKNTKQHIIEFDKMIIKGLKGITEQFEEAME